MKNFLPSLEELKFITPRVALYVGVAYVTIRGVKLAVNSASRLLGLSTDKDCCN